MKNGILRVASISPVMHLCDCEKNATELISALRALPEGTELAVTPEMSLCGYTLGDLFLQPTMLSAARNALKTLLDADIPVTYAVGLPLEERGRLYNCAAIIHGKELLGVVPKTFLPDGGEFYEMRWFTSGSFAPDTISVFGKDVPFGNNLIFGCNGYRFSIEICEDLWAPIPPSSYLAPAGADVILNLSASNELVAKHKYRRELLAQQSGRLICGYVYSGAGFGESTTDLVFSGYTGVFENGSCLAESERFSYSGSSAIADIDVQKLRFQRLKTGSYHQQTLSSVRGVPFCAEASEFTGAYMRDISPLPFVPDGLEQEKRCEEISSIQMMGLVTRLRAAHVEKMVIGVSGGLDSTLCLLIAARTCDIMGLARTSIHAITMPGFGTGGRTLQNSRALMSALNVTQLEIPIAKAVTQHFADIGQSPDDHSVAYENCQARERTQILMDYGNRIGGFVLGTGDLSEGALGWSTYNGDHMSMYNVNCSVPKTLIKHMVRYLGAHVFSEDVRSILADILDTPISPELLPVSEGELSQKTEDILGDYALHDFFLYHMMQSGSGPIRLFEFAVQAFGSAYTEEAILKALSTFTYRFFTQQFKRSCVPDGPKVGSVSLSPRGDWRMPSDASRAEWQKELDKLTQEREG
ncbi:MAG: NAD(+) synthase [Eubacteriales bacterium]|nr:NAD(+) synthase [Eubacteriales bacterium]MDD3882734.1 NAD(+) synthase [Eubacteriales bacterium]MDD4512645.1 NAD(+) synthase [Eubacteriales bacterium]